MRCKTCDYRLWGTTGRECPECGTPFLPSQFEFLPNTVRFCCPHCGQDYYGRGERGHLVPAEFECVQCGQHVHMDEMTLFPAEGLEEERTQVERMPWLDRRRAGFFARWLRTLYMGMFSPTRVMRLTPTDSPARHAWWFAILTAGVASLVGALPVVIFPMVVGGFGGPGMLGVGGVMLLMLLLGGLFGPIVLIGLWGAVAHGVLAVTGRCGCGIGRSYQAMCYSAAPSIMTGVPCLGMYLFPIAWIWWGVSAILMIREGQRVGTARAVTAVLALPAGLTAGLVCLIIFAVMPGIQSARKRSATFVQQANVGVISSGLSLYAAQNSGAPPGHAGELIASQTVQASAFVRNSPRDMAKVPVAGTTLQRFSTSPVSAQRSLAKAAAGALPANVTAHRLGDFVFTYHGIDFSKADPGLWAVILAPEVPPVPAPSAVWIGLANGTITSVPDATFLSALTAQNALRAQQSLPPLPDPRKVTHTQPAAASE